MISLLKKLVAIFLPFRCHVCSHGTDFSVVLCAACRNRLRQILANPFPVHDTCCEFRVYTLSSYDSFVADIIRIIKYHPSYRLLKILAEECEQSEALRHLIRPDDVLIPVPMHAGRLAERGFNQADYLAGRFAARCGCHYSPALVRVRATRPQADCNERERLTNLEHAFALDSGLARNAFSGRRLLLIDDVATTGTTLQRCCEALKPLSPGEICALTVSHSFRRTAKPAKKAS